MSVVRIPRHREMLCGKGGRRLFYAAHGRRDYILDIQAGWNRRQNHSWVRSHGRAARAALEMGDARCELACQSRRPYSRPNQHTEAELKLIRDMRRKNPWLGLVGLWHRPCLRGHTRCLESLFRVMRKQGLFLPKKKKPACKPKPYRQMTYPGRQIRVDVKAAPRRCIAAPEMRLYQHTAIDGLFIGHLFAADHLFLR